MKGCLSLTIIAWAMLLSLHAASPNYTHKRGVEQASLFSVPSADCDQYDRLYRPERPPSRIAEKFRDICGAEGGRKETLHENQAVNGG